MALHFIPEYRFTAARPRASWRQTYLLLTSVSYSGGARYFSDVYVTSGAGIYRIRLAR